MSTKHARKKAKKPATKKAKKATSKITSQAKKPAAKQATKPAGKNLIYSYRLASVRSHSFSPSLSPCTRTREQNIRINISQHQYVRDKSRSFLQSGSARLYAAGRQPTGRCRGGLRGGVGGGGGGGEGGCDTPPRCARYCTGDVMCPPHHPTRWGPAGPGGTL